MIKYIIYVKDEENYLDTFESNYQFSKNENIGDVIYVKKDGKIISLTIEKIGKHDIKEGQHSVRLDCHYNKFFS